MPPPPIAVSMTVPKAMPMLLMRPAALEKLPGDRLIVESDEKPDRFSALPVPPLHSVTTGCWLMEKSKNRPM